MLWEDGYQMPCSYGLDGASEKMDISMTLKLTDEEFTKHDIGKPRYGLIPPLAEREMVNVLTFGARKYAPDNWRKCEDLSRYVDAALRHISSYRQGEERDEETNLHHLAHAMCCRVYRGYRDWRQP
jgi:hypothetical protein